MQPVPNEYDIIAVPFVTPVAVPVDEPMLATAVLLLLHVPPVEALLSDIVDPGHNAATPVIGDADPTVTVVVERHPVVSE
jgi:hypothetical protein